MTQKNKVPLSNPLQQPSGRWFWQRSLRSRILLTYGALSMVTLLAMMVYVGREVYELQLEQAEHDLEVSAFLIANALEDPLSGYPYALEGYGTIDVDLGLLDGGLLDGGLLDENAINDDSDANDGLVDEIEPGDTPAVNNETDDPIINAFSPTTATRVSFQEFVKLNTRTETARVTLLSIHGDVIADSLSVDADLPSQLEQTEIQAALSGLEQHEIRIDPQNGVNTLYAAVPVQQGSRLLGVVRLARPLQEVLAPTRFFLLNLVMGGILALAGTIIIGTALSRYLVNPLQRLQETTERVAQGELDLSVSVESADEVGALAISFNAMVVQLRELIEKQRHFVANASHELRTPLTNIKLRSEAVLAMNAPLAPRAKQYVTEIDSEADRLRRLANTLLNLASIEQSATAPPQVATDIAPLLLEVARSFRMTARQADLTLRARIPEQICPLLVWPDHVVVIVNNLLDNAIKYTAAGGEVYLGVTATAQQLLIEIQDNGAGIPAEDLPHIFERFYRVDKARSRQSVGSGAGSGAGLGLSIVKILVALNQGEINVESSPGKGTKFTVIFACASLQSRNSYIS